MVTLRSVPYRSQTPRLLRRGMQTLPRSIPKLLSRDEVAAAFMVVILSLLLFL